MRPFHLTGKEETKDLVCYLPGGVYWGAHGRITGPDKGWVDARDLEFCKRVNKGTGFDTCRRDYDVRSKWDDNKRMYVPNKWVQKHIYDFAKSKGYERLHLVGFSGGGSVASSQLLYYPDRLVRSLVIISGPVANNPKAVHVNAAYYADQIATRTLLVYGNDDGYRSHADVWRRNNPDAVLKEYDGGHDFQSELDSVAKHVIDWQKSSVKVALRVRKRVRRRKRSQWLRLA